MAIQGLTDKASVQDNRRVRLLGKLRKGAEADGKIGEELPFFRFAEKVPGAGEVFASVYGAEPALIRVFLPYTTPDENFQTWQEAWGKGGLMHRCDGETSALWLGDDGRYHKEPIPCPGGCKKVGRLSLILPDLIMAGQIGLVTLETHSMNDLVNIMGMLEWVYESRRDNPLGLKGIEFSLRRELESIPTPNANGGRTRRDKWLVKIDPSASWMQASVAMLAAVSNGEDAPKGFLPVRSGFVNVDTGEIVGRDGENVLDDVTDAEYHPVEAKPTPEAPKAVPAASAASPKDGNGNGSKSGKTMTQPDENGVPLCPVCGGKMWDNRSKKTNPKAPDYKCRDKGCSGLYWTNEWKPPAAPEKPAPSRPTVKSTPATAGRLSATLVGGVGPLFSELAAHLAAENEKYLGHDGRADARLILCEMLEAGFEKISPDNVMEAFGAITTVKAPEAEKASDSVPW